MITSVRNGNSTNLNFSTQSHFAGSMAVRKLMPNKETYSGLVQERRMTREPLIMNFVNYQNIKHSSETPNIEMPRTVKNVEKKLL